MDFGSKDCAERYCGHGGRRLCEVWRLNEDSQASVPWLSMSRAMEMENPLEPVVEDKEETCQDGRGDVVAGGRDELPNAIPSAPPFLDFLSSSLPLPRWARAKLELNTSGNGTSEFRVGRGRSQKLRIRASMLLPCTDGGIYCIASFTPTVVSDSSKILNSSPLQHEMEHQNPVRKESEVENSSSHSAAPAVESIGSS